MESEFDYPEIDYDHLNYHNLEFHEVCKVFPPLTRRELDLMVEDIKGNNYKLKLPILLHNNGKIIDGRCRYTACMELHIKPWIESWLEHGGKLGEEVPFVLSTNIVRRHLTPIERADIVDELAKLHKGRPIKTSAYKALKEIAAQMQVSPRQVHRVRAIKRKDKEVWEKVKAKEIPFEAGEMIAKLPKAEKEKALAGGVHAIKNPLIRDSVTKTLHRQLAAVGHRLAHMVGYGGDYFSSEEIGRQVLELVPVIDALTGYKRRRSLPRPGSGNVIQQLQELKSIVRQPEEKWVVMLEKVFAVYDALAGYIDQKSDTGQDILSAVNVCTHSVDTGSTTQWEDLTDNVYDLDAAVKKLIGEQQTASKRA